VPGPPTITGVKAGNASIAATFTPPASNGGSAITGYTVTAVPLDAASGPTRTALGAGSPITVTGLTNGAAYNLTVHATNAIGNGPG